MPAIAGLVLLLVLSGFFSGSETALIAVSRYRLGYLANRGDRRAAAVRSLVSDPERLLSTILVGNNFANIAASALATMIAIRLAGEEGAISSIKASGRSCTRSCPRRSSWVED